MNYRSVDLSVDLETARRHISEQVDGLSVTTSSRSVEYRTSSGFHLATLSEVTLPNGERRTRLKYRTAIVSPAIAHARRKATEIRSAVDPLTGREQ